jgi:hypothetical protein
MNKVILKQSGELEDHRDRLVIDALPYLGAHLELDKEFSLRGFVRMLNRYPDLQRLSNFLPGMATRNWPEPEDCPASGLEHLEFARVVEMIGAPEPPRLEVYHILRGSMGSRGDEEIRAWQVENLLDVPIRMGPLRHVVFGDEVQTFNFSTVCTLFDFIDGVIWQLAFHGAPQECALRR